jgi:hypothetical protein
MEADSITRVKSLRNSHFHGLNFWARLAGNVTVIRAVTGEAGNHMDQPCRRDDKPGQQSLQNLSTWT